MYKTPDSLFKDNISLLIACLYLLDSRDREWCLRQPSKYNFGLQWPWPLTSWAPTSTVHVVAWERFIPICTESVHSFSKYSVNKLITDKQNRRKNRTDKRTDRQLDERTNERTDRWTNGQTNGQTDGRTDRQLDERTNERTDRWTNGQTAGRTDRSRTLCLRPVQTGIWNG